MAYGSCLQSTATGFTGAPDDALGLVRGLVGRRRATMVESDVHIKVQRRPSDGTCDRQLGRGSVR